MISNYEIYKYWGTKYKEVSYSIGCKRNMEYKCHKGMQEGSMKPNQTITQTSAPAPPPRPPFSLYPYHFFPRFADCTIPEDGSS
jgi:hypothetical protein